MRRVSLEACALPLHPSARQVRRTLQFAGIATLTASNMALRCSGGVGGGNADTRQCVSTGDDNWESAQIEATNPRPDQCPYVVKSVGNVIPYALAARTPDSPLPPNRSDPITGSAMTMDLTANNGYYLGSNTARWFHPCCNVVGEAVAWQEADYSGSYAAGIGSNPPQDEADFTTQIYKWVDAAQSIATARGSLTLPGQVNAASSSLQGPGLVTAADVATWNAGTPRDTISYSYQWRLNGQSLNGEVGNRTTRQFPIAGAYNLGVAVIRTDLTADTATLALGVAPAATISGPADITSTGTKTWTATPVGCNGSCTYAWSYQTIGTTTWTTLSSTGPSVSRSVGTNTYNFTLRLIVSSAGYSSTTTFGVLNETYSGGGGCGPTAC